MHDVVSFADTAIAIEHEGALARRVVALSLARLARAPRGAIPKTTLQLRCAAEGAPTRLLVDGEEVVSTRDAGLLLTHLQELLAYHFADGCHAGLAVHAGAVAKGERALLFPAQSESGKSTLTAWLVARGFSHMSDELVHVSERDARVQGWLRPIGLRHAALPIIEPALSAPKAEDTWLDTPFGAMLSPGLLSRAPSCSSAALACIAFTRYERGRPAPALRELSGAEASVWLLACTLNARHLKAHGLSAATDLCRRVRGVELVYGSFDALDELLDGLLAGPATRQVE